MLDDIWKTLANDHQSPLACTTKMSQSRKLYAPEEVPEVDWKVLPYISNKWGTGCNDNYAGREALRYTKCKSLEPKQTKMITMQLGIEVQRAKEVSRKNNSKMTKGRKKFGERQLNQSLENRRDDEIFSETFKRSQLNQSLENRRGDDNFDGSLLNQFLEKTSKSFRSELLNQSMEKRGDENFGKSAQPVL